jgi:hypothetical protein
MVCITQTNHERTGLMDNLSHVWDHIQTDLLNEITPLILVMEGLGGWLRQIGNKSIWEAQTPGLIIPTATNLHPTSQSVFTVR